MPEDIDERLNSNRNVIIVELCKIAYALLYKYSQQCVLRVAASEIYFVSWCNILTMDFRGIYEGII